MDDQFSLVRGSLGTALVGTMAVAVTGVASKDTSEMPFVHDQEVVEALGSHGAHKSFGKCVGVRGPIGVLEDLSALSHEDLIEALYVLGATIAHQELCGDVRLSEVTGDIPRLLGDPGGIGMSGHPGVPDSPTAELNEKQHVGPQKFALDAPVGISILPGHGQQKSMWAYIWPRSHELRGAIPFPAMASVSLSDQQWAGGSGPRCPRR